MKKWINNSLWLFGGIMLGGLAVSEDTAQTTEPVAVVAKAEPADTAKTEAAKAKLEAAQAKLSAAKARVAEIEENDRIMNAETPKRPSGLQITLCQTVIEDSNPSLPTIDINVSTSALVPDAEDSTINAVWFQFKAGEDTYTAKCNIKDLKVIDHKFEKTI